MRVLITGAGGLIGQKLISRIQQLGYEPRLLFKDSADNPGDRVGEAVYGDLLDQEAMKDAVAGVDAVIHLAGLTHSNDESSYRKINVSGTRNLLAACRDKGVGRFIFISSRSAGLAGGAYAESKFLAEEEVKKSGLDWVILRLAEVYGAGSHEAVSRLIEIVRASYVIPIIGRGQYKVSPIFIDDAIQGILDVLRRPAISRQTYILAGPEEFTYSDLVDRLAEELNLKRVRLYIPVIFIRALLAIISFFGLNFFVRDQLPRLLSEKSADIGPAVRDFNFRPRAFRSGLKEALDRRQHDQ